MTLRCEKCGKRLYYRKRVNGWVCKNWNCERYWKRGRGYVVRPNGKDDETHLVMDPYWPTKERIEWLDKELRKKWLDKEYRELLERELRKDILRLHGWPKSTDGKTLFVCPYCCSKDGEVRFIPVESGQLIYSRERDLAFHKPCGNHLALRVADLDEEEATFSVLGTVVINLFATLEKFEEEHDDIRLFLKTFFEFDRGLQLVVERVKEFIRRLDSR